MADVAMTLRLPYSLAEDLRIVAGVDGVTQAEAIRVAVDAHLAQRKADPAFRVALQKHVERHQRLVDQLLVPATQEGGRRA